MPDLSGRVALVTGGGGAGGIGEAVCIRLAEYGASVAVADVDTAGAHAVAEALTNRGLLAQAFQHDVSHGDQATRVVAEVERRFGAIDILVNNAGVSHAAKFLDLEEQEWDRVIRINLGGVFFTCKAILPGMVARKSGRVINMASIVGKQGLAGLAAYGASKFAIIGLTQTLAAELAQYDITVNAVCPGVVETPLHDGLVRDLIMGPGGPADRAQADAWTKSQIPLGRPQLAIDVAEMVAFLASDLARNMTAGSYHVDGGLMPR
jgi:NAD(P)-dependent dehydrogenase (short-subunit alcohol dehydrogenase family)